MSENQALAARMIFRISVAGTPCFSHSATTVR